MGICWRSSKYHVRNLWEESSLVGRSSPSEFFGRMSCQGSYEGDGIMRTGVKTDFVRTMRFVHRLVDDEPWVGEEQEGRLVIQLGWMSLCFQIELAYEDEDGNDCVRIIHQQAWDFGDSENDSELPRGVTMEWCYQTMRECWGTPPIVTNKPDAARDLWTRLEIIPAMELLMRLEIIPAFESNDKTWIVEILPQFAARYFRELERERHAIIAPIMNA